MDAMKRSSTYALVLISALFVLAACQPVSPSESRRSNGSGATNTENVTTNPSDKGQTVLSNEGDDDDDDDDDKDEKEEEVTKKDPKCYKADDSICAIEYKIFELTNKLRADNGLRPLEFSPELAWTARDWSSKMGRSGSISHSGFPNQREQVYRKEFGNSAGLTAENVAMTYTGASDVAEEFYDMWRNSAGHRANMLGGSGTLGVGVSQNSQGGWYATQIFSR